MKSRGVEDVLEDSFLYEKDFPSPPYYFVGIDKLVCCQTPAHILSAFFQTPVLGQICHMMHA